jgi:hypothetical protein
MRAIRKATPSITAIEELPLIGRDEMNLADHPLTLLTDRADKTTKTLIFNNAHGTLTVTGSDAHGLPMAQDADVMVALIQLAKLKNNFQEAKVHFTRYELLRLLGWPNEGKSYRRLSASLKRWHGVSLNYEGCWYDKRTGRWGDADIHIIESVLILEGSAKTTDNATQHSLPLSSFEWNRQFLDSCQAGNLKQLDLSLYFSLEHPSSKRLYRYLDKRFYRQNGWVFDLNDIALERVGLSRKYKDAGKIKEKLQPAIEELEGKGYLQPMSRDERYLKDGKVWKIRFNQMTPARAVAPLPAPAPLPPPPPLVAELVKRGVEQNVAISLVAQRSAECITLRIDQLDWKMTRPKPPKNPAGFLVRSILDGYDSHPDFEPKAVREKRAETKRKADSAAAAERRREQEKAQRDQAVDQFIQGLDPAKRQELEAAALAAAKPESRQSYDDPNLSRLRSVLLLTMLRDHIRSLLGMGKPASN